jgi:predicted ribosomally synthesized peptide with nif11-like leader
MSTQTVRDFWQQVKQDSMLQKKFQKIKTDSKEATLAAVARLAAEAGFSVTPADYEAAVTEELSKQHSAGALSERELADVSGGAYSGVYYGAPKCSGPC